MDGLIRRLASAAALLLVVATPLLAQRGPLTDEQKAERWQTERELQSIAIVERKVMIPMRDGVLIPADVYRPKDTSKRYPTIWVRTPYNFNYWDISNGVPRDMSRQLDAVKRGYAWVDMQERGHFFAEGNYDILGPPLSDGEDELDWMTGQPWSNGKVGTTGCSSTAEWQAGVASLDNPGFAAMNVQGFGAGVGRVGPYYEMGNWYRGGAVQMLFIDWLYGEQNQVRPALPAGHAPGGSGPGGEGLRPGPAPSSRRLGEGVLDAARGGHHRGGGRAARHLRRLDAGGHGRRDDQACAQRPRVVPGWAVARQHAAERAGAVVHVVVRRLHRTEPRHVQPRAGARGGRRQETSNGRSSPPSATVPTRAPRRTPSSVSAAWEMPASTTPASSTPSSIAS